MQNTTYFDAYNAIDDRWLCCVEAINVKEARMKASNLSGVSTVFIHIQVRENVFSYLPEIL